MFDQIPGVNYSFCTLNVGEHIWTYIITRSSESDGRSDVTDCFDLQFVLIALIALIVLDCPDCPDWFRLP